MCNKYVILFIQKTLAQEVLDHRLGSAIQYGSKEEGTNDGNRFNEGKTMKRITALLAGLALMSPVAAMALPTLTLTSGSFSVVVEDGSSKDLNSLAGVVTFLGSVGPVWYLNVTIGQSDYAGSFMDLNSVNNTGSSNAGLYPTTLKIDWTAPYSGEPIGAVQLGFGGNTVGSVVFSFAVDGVSVFTSVPLTGAGFKGDGVAHFVPTGDADFSQIVEIAHNRNGSTGFDYSAEPVPEPATILVSLGGLLGLVGVIRRRTA